jgi:hypothetical protein
MIFLKIHLWNEPELLKRIADNLKKKSSVQDSQFLVVIIYTSHMTESNWNLIAIIILKKMNKSLKLFPFNSISLDIECL